MSARNDIINSIYLDWNVFQDIMQNRKSSRLAENLEEARAKHYSIPYSHAHIYDLLRCSNSDYVKSDINKLKLITHQVYIAPHRDGSGFCTDCVSPNLIYEATKENRGDNQEIKEVEFEFQPYLVDTHKISKENIMIPYLEQFGDVMCPELMKRFMNNFLQNCFDDHNLRKEFRESFSEIIKTNEPAVEKLKKLSFYRHIFSSKQEIEDNFIFQSYLSINGRSIESISEEDKIRLAYITLVFSVFKEKIERKNNMNNIITDYLHVYIASKCKYFISGDIKMIEKAKLIYRAFGIKIKVYHVDYFIQNIEFCE
jgi:hypothetical protein